MRWFFLLSLLGAICALNACERQSPEVLDVMHGAGHHGEEHHGEGEGDVHHEGGGEEHASGEAQVHGGGEEKATEGETQAEPEPEHH